MPYIVHRPDIEKCVWQNETGSVCITYTPDDEEGDGKQYTLVLRGKSDIMFKRGTKEEMIKLLSDMDNAMQVGVAYVLR